MIRTLVVTETTSRRQGESPMPIVIDWKHTGRLVAQKRITAGLTQYQLAERLGLSVRQLSELERGIIIRPSAQIVEVARAWLGRRLPELGEVHPIPPPPTPVPRREDIAEAKRRFTILATADPTFWVGMVTTLTAHLRCIEKLQAGMKVKPQIIRTGRQRRVLHEINQP
jgi:transcriptional regulator with XRE-family HTH domain